MEINRRKLRQMISKQTSSWKHVAQNVLTTSNGMTNVGAILHQKRAFELLQIQTRFQYGVQIRIHNTTQPGS